MGLRTTSVGNKRENGTGSKVYTIAGWEPGTESLVA